MPSALRCWSWPDGSTTQTFDRSSPPCKPSWDAARGNGGKTSRGVTRTEVRVGVPADALASLQPLATFFSRHYQLYGRSLRLVSLGTTDEGTAEGQHAAAGAAAEQGVFATLDELSADGSARTADTYLDTLAQNHVIGVLTRSSLTSSTTLAADAPYAWSVLPPVDTAQRALGAAVCRELSGHRAEHAEQVSSRTRSFAVLAPSGYDVEPLRAALGACHQDPEAVTYSASDVGGTRDVLAEVKRSGATTVIPFGNAQSIASVLMPAAERSSYRPEWLLPGLSQQQDPAAWASAPAGQLGSLFGLATWQKHRTAVQQALDEVGSPAAPDGSRDAGYDGLALLAAGVQLAGPALTPSSFAAGLQSVRFPNPGAGEAPDYQPAVDFTDIDHTMREDIAQVWWRDDNFCFVDGGRRWFADEFPYDDPGFFDSRQGC